MRHDILTLAVLGLAVACSRQRPAPQRCAHSVVHASPLSAKALGSVKPVRVTHRVVLSSEDGFDGYGSRQMKGRLGPLEVAWKEFSHRGLYTSSGAPLELYLPDCAHQRKSLKIDVSIDEVALYSVGGQLVVSTGTMDDLKAFRIEPPLPPAAASP